MAQAFVSTHRDHYRWNNQPRAPIFDPEALTKLKPEGDIWLLDANEAIEAELTNIAKIEDAINKLYLKRMKTTYQVSYCENVKPVKKPTPSLSELNMKRFIEDTSKIESKESDQDIGNELLEYCKKLYGPRKSKITPPLSSSRNGHLSDSILQNPSHDKVMQETLNPTKYFEETSTPSRYGMTRS